MAWRAEVYRSSYLHLGNLSAQDKYFLTIIIDNIYSYFRQCTVLPLLCSSVLLQCNDQRRRYLREIIQNGVVNAKRKLGVERAQFYYHVPLERKLVYCILSFQSCLYF